MLVEEYKPKIWLNRPLQIGCAILDVSKLIMYKYYYDVLKPKFKDRLTPLYTDTDSFLLEVKSKNFSKDLRMLRKTLDTSNFPIDHPLFTNKNASRLGFFKSEVGLRRIHVFTSLRSKVYHFVAGEGDSMTSESKLKGVSKAAVKRLGLSSYLNAILRKQRQSSTFRTISSKKHSLSTTKITKQSLFCYDDKIFIRNCGIHIRKLGEKSSDTCSCPFTRL